MECSKMPGVPMARLGDASSPVSASTNIGVAGEVRQHQFVNRKLIVARREQAGGGVDYFHTQREYTADDLLRRFPVRARREHAKTKGEMRRDDPERAGEIDAERYEELLPVMANQALASGSPGNNPRIPTSEEIVDLYRRVYA